MCVSPLFLFFLLFTLLLLFLCFLLPFANSANKTTNYAFSSPAKAEVERGGGGGVIVVIVCISQCATDSLTLLFFSSLLSSPTLHFVFMFRCNNNNVHTTHTRTQARPLSATSAEVMRGMLRYSTTRPRPSPRPRTHPCSRSHTAQTDRKSVRLSSSICKYLHSVCLSVREPHCVAASTAAIAGGSMWVSPLGGCLIKTHTNFDPNPVTTTARTVCIYLCPSVGQP